MALFTSERERRLWMRTLAVLVAIYSTLGQAGKLTAFLRKRNLLRLSIGLVLTLVVGGIARQWLKTRPRRSEIGAAIAIASAYVIAWIRINTPEERSHLIEYGLVAVLIHQALLERQRHDPRVPSPAGLAMGATAILGWVDEGIQALLPNRVYDIRDVGFNALAGFMAVMARVAIARARQRDG